MTTVCSQIDFDNFVRDVPGNYSGFFGSQIGAIETIHLKSNVNIQTGPFDPLPELYKICLKAGMNCKYRDGNPDHNVPSQLEQPGCVVKFLIRKNMAQKAGTYPPQLVSKDTWLYNLECNLSPELFEVNAPLLQEWLKQVSFPDVIVSIELMKQIKSEVQRHHFTAKLFRAGVKCPSTKVMNSMVSISMC
jgi:hypothetical protein